MISDADRIRVKEIIGRKVVYPDDLIDQIADQFDIVPVAAKNEAAASDGELDAYENAANAGVGLPRSG
jgi:hypothetical protein